MTALNKERLKKCFVREAKMTKKCRLATGKKKSKLQTHFVIYYFIYLDFRRISTKLKAFDIYFKQK